MKTSRRIFYCALRAWRKRSGIFLYLLRRVLRLIYLGRGVSPEYFAHWRNFSSVPHPKGSGWYVRGCAIVDYFGYELIVFSEIKFVAYANLSRGINNYVLKAVWLVKFPFSRNTFIFCAGFFFTAIHAGRKNLLYYSLRTRPYHRSSPLHRGSVYFSMSFVRRLTTIICESFSFRRVLYNKIKGQIKL